MYKNLFLSAPFTAIFATNAVIAEDLNQPQDHRSTINQVGQPIDNRIDSESRQNQSATPITPPETQSLPANLVSSSVTIQEPPSPLIRINPQTPHTTYPTSRVNNGGPSPSVPDHIDPILH